LNARTNASFAAEDKNNKIMSSEGMEATEEEIQESFGDDDDDDDDDGLMDPANSDLS
jgi:hypothetical protein